MLKFKIEEVLVEQCRGNHTHKETNELLRSSGISQREYNEYILRLLDYKKTLAPLIPQMRVPVGSGTQERLPREADAQDMSPLDMAKVFRNMDEFYRIANCPSFLYHDRILSSEDISFFLEIYSKFYGLEYTENPTMTTYVHEFLCKYAEDILNACDNKTTVVDLKKMFRK